MGRVTGVPTVAAVGVEERDVGRGTREGREGVDTAATPRFPGRLKAPNFVISVGVVNPGGNINNDWSSHTIPDCQLFNYLLFQL